MNRIGKANMPFDGDAVKGAAKCPSLGGGTNLGRVRVGLQQPRWQADSLQKLPYPPAKCREGATGSPENGYDSLAYQNAFSCAPSFV